MAQWSATKVLEILQALGSSRPGSYTSATCQASVPSPVKQGDAVALRMKSQREQEVSSMVFSPEEVLSQCLLKTRPASNLPNTPQLLCQRDATSERAKSCGREEYKPHLPECPHVL